MNANAGTSKTQNGLRSFGIGMLGLLALQYVLGMVTNLYVQFPQTDQISQLWDAARSQFASAAHILLGVLLLVGAILFVIRAAMNREGRWIVSSAVGLAGIVVAAFGGVTFVNSQGVIFSLIMSLGFLGALVAYGWGLFMTRR